MSAVGQGRVLASRKEFVDKQEKDDKVGWPIHEFLLGERMVIKSSSVDWSAAGLGVLLNDK